MRREAEPPERNTAAGTELRAVKESYFQPPFSVSHRPSWRSQPQPLPACQFRQPFPWTPSSTAPRTLAPPPCHGPYFNTIYHESPYGGAAVRWWPPTHHRPTNPDNRRPAQPHRVPHGPSPLLANGDAVAPGLARHLPPASQLRSLWPTTTSSSAPWSVAPMCQGNFFNVVCNAPLEASVVPPANGGHLPGWTSLPPQCQQHGLLRPTTTSTSANQVCIAHVEANAMAGWASRLPSCRQLGLVRPTTTSTNGSTSITANQVTFPSAKFEGRIVYCRTTNEVEQATVELLHKVNITRTKMNSIPLGFDIEWKPVFKKGEQRKAAVMQICVDNVTCYVMHIIHSGIPWNLKSLLEDKSCTKVGMNIADDARKMFQDYNVRLDPLVDLSKLANLKLCGVPKQWGLASLTERLTCKKLPKPQNIRMGNWEKDVLSDKELQYAATDAYVSWYLYELLRNMPDAKGDDGHVEKEMSKVPKKRKKLKSLYVA